MKIDSRIDTVLFDLDGTLVPMDLEEFTTEYFKELSAKAAVYGYDPEETISSVWAATKAMMQNDGSASNMEVFWEAFCRIMGEDAAKLQIPFDGFYSNEFDRVKRVAKSNPHARPLIDHLKAKGYTVALATNPFFPLDGNLTRMSWVGLNEDDFSLITSYETSRYCKPNLGYYREVLERLSAEPEHCIMIGNDTVEDLAAEALGMDTFIVKDFLINKDGRDLSAYKQGGFEELADFFDMN